MRKNVEYAKEPAAPLSRAGSGGSAYANSLGEANRRTSLTLRRRNERAQALDSFGDRDGSILGDDETSYGDDDGGAPRADDFELLATSAKTQIELTQQLLSSLGSSGGSEVKEALGGSLKTLGSIFEEYVDVVAQRERYFNRKFEKEIEIKRLWEQSMKDVAAQHAKVEAELERFGRDNVRKTKALYEVRANLTGSPISTPSVVPEGLVNPIDQLPEHGVLGSLPPPLQTLNSNTRISRSRASTGNLSPTRSRLRSATITHTLNPNELEQLVDSALAGEGDESEDDDEEFFEAIESGSIPFSSDLPAAPVSQAQPTQAFMDALDLTPYKGYENLRSRLPIDSDNRPVHCPSLLCASS